MTRGGGLIGGERGGGRREILAEEVRLMSKWRSRYGANNGVFCYRERGISGVDIHILLLCVSLSRLIILVVERDGSIVGTI